MNLEVGKFYKISFEINGKTLTYSCEILPCDDEVFISFKDRYGKVLSYSKRLIISFEEIEESALNG